MDLRERLIAEIERREAIAQHAHAAKPGDWTATPTHDGFQWEGHSHVYATEDYEDDLGSRRITRGVAHLIADSLELTKTAFSEDKPPAAVVAEHIALHAPADALRRYTHCRNILRRHRPMAGDPRWCRQCTLLDGLQVPADCPDIVALAVALNIPTEGAS